MRIAKYPIELIEPNWPDVGETITMDPLVIFKNATKSFGIEAPLFRDFSLDFLQGDLTSLVGATGVGKSTLLSLINGVLKPDTGSIEFKGDKRITVGTVLQKDLLLPWRTIIQNVTLGMELSGKRMDLNRVSQSLNDFGLAGSAKKYPGQLSGGMRQKVSLLRTLLIEPDLLLLDEPFAHIDYFERLELEAYCCNWVKTKKITAVLVTHDLEEAIAMSNRVVVLRHRPADVALDVRIDLHDAGQLNPIGARKDDRFYGYLNQLWSALK